MNTEEGCPDSQGGKRWLPEGGDGIGGQEVSSMYFGFICY